MSEEFANRMKDYEACFKYRIPKKSYIILRLDGKCFSSFTKKMTKPFCENLSNAFIESTKRICASIDGAKFAYTQSDEVSILVHDRSKIETAAWFDNKIQKMVSVGASMFTAYFNEAFNSREAFFDARVFSLPKDEVCNYFIWRQMDCTRNSISAVGQANFSHKELHGKNISEIQDMLMLQKGINWNDLAIRYKRGVGIFRKEREEEIEILGKTVKVNRSSWTEDYSMPVFTTDREYVEKYL